jgi:uncharacterized membrane protein YphA (DoxX/SURF4 family)
LIARLILGGVFIKYSFEKIGGFEQTIAFLKLIKQYKMMPLDPPFYLNYTALILPWLEMVCAVALILGIFVRGAGVTVFGMLVVFTIAIGVRAVDMVDKTGMSFFDIEFDCGCGGGPVNIFWKLVANSTWILLSLIPIFSRSRWLTLEKAMSSREGQPAAGTLADIL